MGGEYVSHSLTCTRDELQKKYLEFVDECLYDYGHSGYSGSFAEKPELKILDKECRTDDEAEVICCDGNEKWGPAWAVHVLEPEPHWYIGGWCSS